MVSSGRGNPAWVRGVLAIAIGVASLAQAANAERQSISLNEGWEFRQRLEESGGGQPAIVRPVWHQAQVPGVVQTDLLRNKLIPDPFFRSNEFTLQCIALLSVGAG